MNSKRGSAAGSTDAPAAPGGARIVCQFSCGAASAVATKLALAQYGATHDVLIVNAYLREEHPDNRRFLADCERWFGRPVTDLRDTKYGASTHELFRQRRYMNGPKGAACSRALKRTPLDAIARPGDVLVFGFTVEEADRFFDIKATGRECIAPLIERGLTKDDCKAMIERAGIELPVMYRMGYANANCIGCVKGGEGYWRAIREDFPEQFNALADIQDSIGPGAYLFRNRKTGERFSLRDLGDGPVTRGEPMAPCSFFCVAAEKEYAA
jgi:hypothetical protein